MNKEICTICKKNIATWCYMPGYATLPGEKKPSPYECDDCVHRGCTCNYRYVDINSYYPPLDNPDMPEGIEGKDWWKALIADIADKHYAELSLKQKSILRKITVTAWDIIQAQSGGHKNITNISGLNFIGKGYVDIIKTLAMDCAKALSKLQGQ